MNVLSLFDGISTGYLALKELGFQIDHYYASEIDQTAIKTSRFNYRSHIEQIGDCCLISPKQLKQMKVDLLIAGSPCQGFSRQGSGLNFEDPRSRLFFVFLRILKKNQTIQSKCSFHARKCIYENRMERYHITIVGL